LLVFSSMGIIVLAGLGIYEVTQSILEIRESSSATSATSVAKVRKTNRKRFDQSTGGIQQQPFKTKIIRIVSVIMIIFMLSIPMIYPPNSNWLISADIPPSIANGGTGYKVQTNDWIDALDWISKNTPKNAVIASWWDYGYWITTMGNRTSLADNGTINQTRIQTIAKMFIEKPADSINIARQLKADYILVYIVGQRLASASPNALYTLGNGGDESKKQWFIRIGGFNENKYLEQDGVTPTPLFWNTTFLGQLMPFTVQGYASRTNVQAQYSPGTIAIYSKNIKYPESSGNTNQPLNLVYASPSFNSNDPGLVFGVLIYKVNPNYVPNK
jgi:dolichyl-diphosphooligosaccharide--protein glycosyltransferase